MPDEKTPISETAVYQPDALKRLVQVLWNSREEPKIQSVLFYVVLGAFAGLRPAEAVALEWKQIDWLKREIRIETSTGKSSRSVPIHDNLLTVLLPYEKRNGLVVVHKKVANLLRNECASAGVAHISNGLRRSYASYRLGQSSEEIVLNEMGLDASQPPEWKVIPAAEVAKYWSICP